MSRVDNIRKKAGRMIQANRRLKNRSAVEVDDTGFTLIELLIVIVVLGILAAIVVFALNGVTGQSAAAACQSDAKTVGIGVAALETENPTTTPATSAAWQADLLGNTLSGAPFLQSWPNSQNYTIKVAIGADLGAGVMTQDGVIPITGVSGTAVVPAAGDVLVTATNNANKVYDATVNPDEACLHLKALS